MKKFIYLFLFLLVSFVANSQTLRPSTTPSPNSPSGYSLYGYSRADSGFIWGRRDTFPARFPTVIWHPNGNFYKTTGNGAAWTIFASSTAGTVGSVSGNAPLSVVNGTSNPVISVDTSFDGLTTKKWLYKSIDSLGFLKLNIADTAAMLLTRLKVSDTAFMLSPYLRKSDTASLLSGYARKTININTNAPLIGGGDLSANRTISADTGRAVNQLVTGGSLTAVKDTLLAVIASSGGGTVLSVATTNGVGINSSVATATSTPNITIAVDTFAISTRAWRNKGVDSAIGVIPLRISDSLAAVNRIKAGGSGGVIFQTNSGATAFSYGAGGSQEVDFHGFAGYDANRSSTYTVRSFTDKRYVDSSLSLRLLIGDTATMLSPYRRTTTKITNSDLANSTISGIPLGSNLAALTFGEYLQVGASSYNGSTATTITTNGTSTNAGSTLVARDINGDFAARNITATLLGNASSSSTVSVTNDITTNATYYPMFSTSVSGNISPRVSSSKLTFNPSNGNLTATTFTGNLVGNATTASALQTARTINGVAFDGTSNITISAAVDSSLSAGYGITGSPFNGSLGRTWVIDTSNISTKANVNGLLVGYTTTAQNALKLNISDTTAMLSNYLRSTTAAGTYKAIADTFFNGGYTTRARLKQYGDSLSAAYISADALKKNIADTFFTTGYTTRARTKQQTDSLGALKLNKSLLVPDIQKVPQYNQTYFADGITSSNWVSNYSHTNINANEYKMSTVPYGSGGKYGAWLTPNLSGDSIKIQVPYGVTIGNSIIGGRPSRNGVLQGGPAVDTSGTIAFRLRQLTNMFWFNYGIGGQTTVQIWARWYTNIFNNRGYLPKIIVADGGVNDIFAGVPLSITKEMLTNMAASCDSNNIVFVLMNCPGDSTANYSVAKKIDSLNTWLAEGGLAQYRNTVVYDFNTWWRNPTFNDNVHRNQYIIDEIHPSPAGYDSLATDIFRTVNMPVLTNIVFNTQRSPLGFSGFSRPTSINVNNTTYAVAASDSVVIPITQPFLSDSIWVKINASTNVTGTSFTGFSSIAFQLQNSNDSDYVYTRRFNAYNFPSSGGGANLSPQFAVSAGNAGIQTANPLTKIQMGDAYSRAETIAGAGEYRTYYNLAVGAIDNRTAKGGFYLAIPDNFDALGNFLTVDVEVNDLNALGNQRFTLTAKNNKYDIYYSNQAIVNPIPVRIKGKTMIVGDSTTTWDYTTIKINKLAVWYGSRSNYTGYDTCTWRFVVDPITQFNSVSGTAPTLDFSPIPTNGSGTVNYVPKFTTTRGFGNSQIFDNGSHIGIGTTSPNVSGYSKAVTISSANSALELTSASNVVQGTVSSNSNGLTFEGIGTNGIRFFTSSSGATTNRARIMPNGRFIMTSAADNGVDTIQANGSIIGTTLKGTNGFNLMSSNTDRGGLYGYSTLIGSGTDFTPTLIARSGLGLNFVVNNDTSRGFFVQTTGNVVFKQNIIKSGGTSSQYLMADGSVRTNVTSSIDTGRATAQIVTGGSLNKVRDSLANLIVAPNIASGTYTPTLTAVTNVSSTTSTTCQYMRVGNTVTISGKVRVTGTTAGTTATISITLPIAQNNFANSYEAAGSGGFIASNTYYGATLSSNSGAQTIALSYIPTSLGNDEIYFTVTYQIK